MYAVGIVNLNGHDMIPCGNNGLQKLHNQTTRGWKSECQTISKMNDEVWVVDDFSQKMCEMENDKLVEHVRKIGIRLM